MGFGIFGMIASVLTKIVDVIAAVVVYLGLYIPMFYLIVVLGLWLWGGLIFEPSLGLTLFYVGLAISLMCSVVLTLRHLIFEPFGRYLDKKEEERLVRQARRDNAVRSKRRRDKRADDRSKADRQRHADSERYADRYDPRRDEYHRAGTERERPPYRERPMVYRSTRDSSLIIYEYGDRFDVYRETDRGLRQIDTKWK